jgi:hypothetical protein
MDMLRPPSRGEEDALDAAAGPALDPDAITATPAFVGNGLSTA